MAPAPKEDDLPIKWEWIKEDIIDGLLNLKETSTDLTLVDPDDPANFTQFAKVLVGTMIATVTVGFAAIQQAAFEVAAGYPTAIASFTEDVVTAVLNVPGDLLATAADASSTGASEWGLLSFVAGVGLVLVSLWIVAKGVEVIR